MKMKLNEEKMTFSKRNFRKLNDKEISQNKKKKKLFRNWRSY